MCPIQVLPLEPALAPAYHPIKVLSPALKFLPASDPRQVFLLVSVNACPARSPIQTFSYPEVILSPASCPNRTLLLELLVKLVPASVPSNIL